MQPRPRLSKLLRCGGALLLLVGTPSLAQGKKKKDSEQIKQDPLDTEANPQNVSGPQPNPNPGTPTGTGTAPQAAGPARAAGGAAGNSGEAATHQHRFLLTLRAGAAPCVYSVLPCGSWHQGLVGLEFAWAMSETVPAYLVVPVQVQFRPNQGTLMLPVGVQHNIALPVHGLFLYPRVSLGYAATMVEAAGSVITEHFGVAIPEIGLKYVFGRRYHLGGEPFSLPVFFSANGVQVHYRLAVAFGLSF